jgi:integrase
MLNQLSIVQTSTPKVQRFLDSISRNSMKSMRSYSSALTHFQNFLFQNQGRNGKYSKYSIETILKALSENKINIYELFDDFISFLLIYREGITPKSISLYLSALKSYFAFYDVDVIPSKFRRKVKVPKLYREDEHAIDVEDIRKILLSCNNRRLKAYLLILASSGLRAVEGASIRLRDIDLSSKPVRIRIRKEYSKTRTGRDTYISDESTIFLKQWIDWKYRNNGYVHDNGNTKDNETANSNNLEPNEKLQDLVKRTHPNDLIFSIYSINQEPNPNNLYIKLLIEFEKVLKIARMDERKEGTSIYKRRKITLHSFRRFVKTVISNQVNQDYSEWFLGHTKSPYYTIKEQERREIYTNKCMKYLTFLDYTTLEARGKSIEVKLREKDREIQAMKDKYESEIEAIRDETNQKFNQIMAMIQQNSKLAQVKPEALISKNL